MFIFQNNKLCSHILKDHDDDDVLAGHPGERRIFELMNHKLWWPSLCTGIRQSV
ncbi:hypothetical protein SERLA73DRAFT_43966 [Serpula lacrymans var. lacrymans S7.3]|uniref:Integrase zinc-binding domain-containing protein n=1 Tax=Serpula lacrymans var. lacrymans (strain S7.3) TaxID=936435 RepID=F8PHU3_SERL3|nr:hypothetical protein SERLA73DRAFT_43966 [Serpula lacrymans var. lacrymans S7.3]